MKNQGSWNFRHNLLQPSTWYISIYTLTWGLSYIWKTLFSFFLFLFSVLFLTENSWYSSTNIMLDKLLSLKILVKFHVWEIFKVDTKEGSDGFEAFLNIDNVQVMNHFLSTTVSKHIPILWSWYLFCKGIDTKTTQLDSFRCTC